jgi:hypothetical protein
MCLSVNIIIFDPAASFPEKCGDAYQREESENMQDEWRSQGVVAPSDDHTGGGAVHPG